jgi:hypothetical protein
MDTSAEHKQKYSTGSKIFLAVATVLSLVNLVDFAFYGREPTDLVIGIGFALMIYGTYKNGSRSPPAEDDPTFDKAASYGSAAGVVMVFAAIAAEYLL